MELGSGDRETKIKSFSFLRILFIHETERQRERERETGSPWSGEPDVGLDPRTLRS